ncbi:hypothetical protein CLOP_g12192 [Closterium sp. NIES-67]|nr:hypothetical protein CLOP_g12192 [Closterium sp. NIES-67]
MPPLAPSGGANALTSARSCASALCSSCARWFPRSHERPSPGLPRKPLAANSRTNLAHRRCPPLQERVGRGLKSAGHGEGRRLAAGESAVGGREGGEYGGRRGDLLRSRASRGDAVSSGGGGRGGGRGGGEGGGGGGGGAGRGGYRSLGELANAVEACFFELCVHNSGRPAASALRDLVAAAAEAFLAGHSMQRLLLQMQYGGGAEAEEFKMSAAGYRLTSSEEGYRTQWIKTVYLTMFRLHLQQPGASFIHMPPSQRDGGSSSSGGSEMGVRPPSLGAFEGAMPALEQPPADTPGNSGKSDQHNDSSNNNTSSSSSSETSSETISSRSSMGALEGLAEALYEEPWLGSIVDRVLEGQRTGEEQSLVHFDRALATGGASGGVAAEARVIAPQWLPISQLVLLTCKVVNERGGAA